MFVGTFVGIVHGATLPILLILLGNVTNLFTDRSSNLCTLNITSLSQLYCPSNITLDQSNIQDFYRYKSKKTYLIYSLTLSLFYFRLCNFTGEDILPSSSEFSSQVGQQSAYIVGEFN